MDLDEVSFLARFFTFVVAVDLDLRHWTPFLHTRSRRPLFLTVSSLFLAHSPELFCLTMIHPPSFLRRIPHSHPCSWLFFCASIPLHQPVRASLRNSRPHRESFRTSSPCSSAHAHRTYMTDFNPISPNSPSDITYIG